MDFTEDPFKDYRYEDPFNIDDPFADAVDSRRPVSVAGFETGLQPAGPPRGGRASAPPARPWPADSWPADSWAADDAWAEPAAPLAADADAWPGNTGEPAVDWKTDNWASKADGWAADWGADRDRNLNETWPSSTLPGKKARSPKPVQYAKSLVHTIGGIGRTKHSKEKKAKALEALPSEEQQWAWAAAESSRLQAERDARRRQEDAELQLALAISRQEK